jgi:LPXTG-motif cell wall-anchored protein
VIESTTLVPAFVISGLVLGAGVLLVLLTRRRD